MKSIEFTRAQRNAIKRFLWKMRLHFLAELKVDSKATESVIEVSKGCVNSNFDVVDVNMNISLWFSGEIVAGV